MWRCWIGPYLLLARRILKDCVEIERALGHLSDTLILRTLELGVERRSQHVRRRSSRVLCQVLTSLVNKEICRLGENAPILTLVLLELLLEFVVLLFKIQSLVLLDEICRREMARSFFPQGVRNTTLRNSLLIEFLLLLLGFLRRLLLVGDSLLLGSLGFLLLLLAFSFGLASFPQLLVLELLTGSLSGGLSSLGLVRGVLLGSSLLCP